jgi:regulator of protease activity HflC (stomatin/prohibitin superfamily)
MFKRFKIRKDEIGLLFSDGSFQRALAHGVHWMLDLFNKHRATVVSMREVIFAHEKLDEMVKAGAFVDRAMVVDLKDSQRALVWIDGRFRRILGPGLYALWTAIREVRVEIVDAHCVRFEHKDFGLISRNEDAKRLLDICEIKCDHAGVAFIDGKFHEVVGAGRYAFWLGIAAARLVEVDLREQTIDVSGQDLMTADKVTLRLNAMATFRISDPRKSVSASDNPSQALYRTVQLALRTIVGVRQLDEFLADKDAVAVEALAAIQSRANELGLEVISIGIRDIILPGDMKDLMNKVIEAKKAAEANLIARREETAAMRSQANTAKLLEASPMLMRLRELEVLEKVAASTSLQVVLGDKGLSDQLTKLI